MSGHEAENVVSVNLSTLAMYVKAGAHGVCMLTLPLADAIWLVYRSLSGPTHGTLRIHRLDRRNHRASPRSRP